ncbi:hypothetical protein K443DRAFT_438541 [Laccaria amethystina LaAM-08-1]|uniref:Uncharacterized protein n=1 Tax=Laccaria amethystina LaAM-08-1 TaxID=1095629 RepID=A0A0C9WNX7_9AGAR|nr:hypothetical protein K443DRAFT_438541 [Laccaria amethystina LaAM-08-1]
MCIFNPKIVPSGSSKKMGTEGLHSCRGTIERTWLRRIHKTPKDVPFWFETYQERTAGYSLPKLVVPNTDLGLNLAGDSATLLPLSRVAGLFILPNTPKSQQTIVRGQLVVPLPLDNRVASGLDLVNSGLNICRITDDLPSPGNAVRIW